MNSFWQASKSATARAHVWILW